MYTCDVQDLPDPENTGHLEKSRSVRLEGKNGQYRVLKRAERQEDANPYNLWGCEKLLMVNALLTCLQKDPDTALI